MKSNLEKRRRKISSAKEFSFIILNYCEGQSSPSFAANYPLPLPGNVYFSAAAKLKVLTPDGRPTEWGKS